MHLITNMMGTGGAEVMLLRLASVIGGERPIIVSLMDVSDRHRQLIADHGLDVRSLQVRSTAGMMKSVLTVRQLIQKERPDALMCWLYHAMVVGQLAAWRVADEVPVYWNVRQSLDDMGSFSASTRTALRLTRLLSRGPAGIVFNSSRALHLHRQFGYRNRNLVTIPNGFDFVQAAPVEARRPEVFGIAGRLHAQKDYATFFAAAAQAHRSHPAIRFIVAGAGLTLDNPSVRQMIAEAGLPLGAIDLRGNVSDMAHFYRDIDALVLSSRTEGFPNVVAEAMSFGKPVISTDVGDAAVIVGDSGFIVPPGDVLALADAMGRMLALGPSEYAMLAVAAKRRVESSYPLARVAELYDSFFRGAPVSPAAP
jgi:glycosyltransferase involved in cell wall biosynthesis